MENTPYKISQYVCAVLLIVSSILLASVQPRLHPISINTIIM